MIKEFTDNTDIIFFIICQLFPRYKVIINKITYTKYKLNKMQTEANLKIQWDLISYQYSNVI